MSAENCGFRLLETDRNRGWYDQLTSSTFLSPIINFVVIRIYSTYESFCFRYLADSYRTMADNDELLDYEDEEQQIEPAISNGTVDKKDVRGNYVSIHSSGFRDFLLKPEILRAIIDCGFEHPSEGESLNTRVDFCFRQSRSCFNIPNSV